MFSYNQYKFISAIFCLLNRTEDKSLVMSWLVKVNKILGATQAQVFDHSSIPKTISWQRF